MSEKIIEFDKVVAGYSPSLTILNETTLDACRGEITLLIGPNGAGKATLLRPRVLLIDEPSIGLSPKLVQEVMTLLRELADSGVTVLMVEQNVRTALKFANRALVLEMGRLALDRPASELLHDPDLNRLFLGGHATKSAA